MSKLTINIDEEDVDLIRKVIPGSVIDEKIDQNSIFKETLIKIDNLDKRIGNIEG